MKILFLTPQIPYPPHSGGRIVTWNTIKRFAEQCDVSVVSLYHDPSELEALDVMKKVCSDVAAFPAHGKWSLLPMLRSFVSTEPYKAHRFYNRQMAEFVQNLIEQKQIGVIHAQNFYTTKYVNPHWQGLKIHYKENVEGNVLLRYAKASSNPLKKVGLWMEGHRTRRFEINACKKFDHVLSISPLDRDTLNSLYPPLNVTHQRPGVDLDEYPYKKEKVNDPVAVFTGTLSYYPNVDGVLYFLHHCWQQIRNRIPNARFVIVGSNPPDSILRYHNQDGITVTGRVPDIQPYIDDAQVYLVPLRVGGGIRLKILEAMASGCSIVSTPVGCEGLDGEHNKHLMTTDMPHDFTAAVIQLFQQHERRNGLRKNARQLVEDVYDWDKVVHNQIKQYQQWLDEYKR